MEKDPLINAKSAIHQRCQAHTAIVNNEVYGEGVQIKNEESINHVAGRVGKALRDFVQMKSNIGEGVGGSERGSLNQGTRSTIGMIL